MIKLVSIVNWDCFPP